MTLVEGNRVFGTPHQTCGYDKIPLKSDREVEIMKRKLLLFLAITMILVAAGTTLAADVKEIAVTYVKAPLNVPSIVEKRLDLFEKEFDPLGIEITHPELTAGPKQTQAIAAGSVQFANCLGGTSALLAASAGVDLKVIGIFGRAPEAFVVLTKDPAIKTVADLKGLKVAGPKGTVLHQLLVAALGRDGLKASDVDFLSMGLMDGVTAMLTGRVDAALAAGPAVLKAQGQGARILTDGRGLVDATTVIAVSGSFLREHPDLVDRFLTVHRQALDFMRDNEAEALKLTAEETGLTPEGVARMYPLYDFDPTIRPSDVEELEKTQEFLIANDLMRQRINVQDLVVVGQ